MLYRSISAEHFNELIEKDDWQKVEMFHLDEYIDLPESHLPASENISRRGL